MLNAIRKKVPTTAKRSVRRSGLNIWDSLQYARYPKNKIQGDIRHIVFICKGNICRSPFSEYYLKSKTNHFNLKIDSCGLDVDQGVKSPEEAVQVGKEFGIDLSAHQSRGIKSSDLQNADLIFVMEFKHYLRVARSFPEIRKKIHMLRRFASWPENVLCNINDPYGTGAAEFRSCFKRIQESVNGLMAYL